MDTSSYRRPVSLELTTNPDANRLIAQNPVAFLIGWILDQQVKVQQAFAAPLELQRRLGSLDPANMAAMPEQELIDVFVEKPVLHRYGRSMAKRVRACMQLVVDRYEGDPERIWLEADDYQDLERRLKELPGFGPTKVPSLIALLARRFGLAVTGFEPKLMPYGSLSDVVVYDDLLAYQARKGEYKAAKRAAAVKA